MEALIVNGIFIGFFVIAAAGVIWVILATVRRTRAGGKSIAVGLVVALVTAVIVFVLTYCSAWAEFVGMSPGETMVMVFGGIGWNTNSV